MMTCKLYILAAAMAAAAATPALAQKTVTLTGDDNYSQQSLTVGDSLVIKLAEAPGYAWKLAPSDSAVLTMESPKAGARPARTQVITLTAANPGIEKITLNNVKKTESAGAKPMQVYEVMVGVNSRPGEAKPGVVVSRFDRHMPCADCVYTTETLTLYAKSADELVDTVYEDQTVYQDKDPSTTYTEKGTWVLMAGTKDDPSAPVFVLTDSKGAVHKYWQKATNELVPLDDSGAPLPEPAGKPLITPQ